jgi:hypothetical protein
MPDKLVKGHHSSVIACHAAICADEAQPGEQNRSCKGEASNRLHGRGRAIPSAGGPGGGSSMADAVSFHGNDHPTNSNREIVRTIAKRLRSSRNKIVMVV